MSALLVVLRLALALCGVSTLALLTLWSGPDIEVAIAPVLVRQSVGNVERYADGHAACWTSYFGKARSADPIDANWTIRAAGRIYPFQRVIRVADSDEAGNGLVRRQVKPAQWSRKCIDIPPELIGQPFSITGFAEYRTALTGRLWTIRQPVAEVSVP